MIPMEFNTHKLLLSILENTYADTDDPRREACWRHQHKMGILSALDVSSAIRFHKFVLPLLEQ